MLYREIIEAKEKDMTKQINNVISSSKIKDGFCNIFVQTRTSGLIIMDDHPLLIEDFKRFFAEMDQRNIYNHPDAFAHLRASFLKQAITIPVSNSCLFLEERQRLLYWEFGDNEKKKVIVTVYGK